MASPTPIIIGQYCADFTIETPLSGNDFYYYAAVLNNKTYYLATSRVTHGDGTTTNNVDASDSSTVRVIDSTFVVPTSGAISISGATPFREFRFKLNWYPQIKPDFSTSITPLNRRRYLNWEDVSSGTTGLLPPVETKLDRYVEIERENVTNRDVKFSGSTLTATQVNSLNNNVRSVTANDLTLANITGMRFFATTKSPTIQTRATRLKYLIVKSDLETLNSQSVTARKQLRYLIWNNTFKRFELLDLFDPDVTTTMIQRCAFRFSSQSNYNLNGGDNTNVSTTGTNAPTADSTGVGASITLPSTVTTTIGVTAYWHPTLGQTVSSLTVTNSFTDPTGTSATALESASYVGIFGAAAGDGFSQTDFKLMSDGTTQTQITDISASGYQNSFITFPAGRLDYVDFATSGYSTASPVPTVVASGDTLQYVITDFLVDKAIEELFTDVSVTLLKVQRYSSPTLSVGSPGVSGNNEFLGFEIVTPSNNPSAVAGASAAATLGSSGSSTIDLIVRDYYKFRDPARATQFKFYDLGKGTEYLWQVNYPTGTTSVNFGYITHNGTNIQISPASAITSQDQRGWILEYDTGVTPPGVRLRWAGLTGSSNYFRLTGTPGTDSSPARVNSTLGTRAEAAIFNCIMCSQIDSAGQCIPITSNPYMGQNTPPGRSPVQLTQTSPTGGSPVPGTSFKIRELSGTSPGPRFLQYTVTQFQTSPAPSIVYFSSSPSPAPTGSVAVSNFILTRQGTLSSASRANQAVFIRSATNSTLYLRAIPTSGSTRVEIVSTNNPSDDEGFAWRIEQATASSNQVRIYSVSTADQTAANRYLQTNDASTIGAKGTPGNVFVFDALSSSDVTSVRSSPMPA
jgi:hypothetical protein